MQRLATTRLDRFAPLLVGGQPVRVAWAQLHRFLAQALSPAHAELLAEPREDPEAGTVDWYGPDGAPRLLDAAGKARRDALMAEIAGLAKDLGRARDEARRRLGRLLVQAMAVPPDAPAWQVGDQPVLVAWGHAAPVRSRDRWRSLIALAWVLLLGGLAAFWLARALGLPLPGCRVDPAEPEAMARLEAERDRGHALRQRLAEARRGLAEKRAQCAPPAPAAPKPPASSLPPQVRPSMPATPPKPVETAPLPPPASGR